VQGHDRDLVAFVLQQRERSVGEVHRVPGVAREQVLLGPVGVGRRERAPGRAALEDLDRLRQGGASPIALADDRELRSGTGQPLADGH
jgi:hypothetical protein